MFFLGNLHLPLTTSRLETPRCILVPFSTDGRVDIRELQEEFCRANKNLYVSPFLPTYEQEVEFVKQTEEKIARGEEFENFIIERETGKLLGAGGLRVLKSGELNIGIWIREDEHGKGYATEVYSALIDWARENTDFPYLRHALHPDNIGSRKLVEKFGGVLKEQKTERGHHIYHIFL